MWWRRCVSPVVGSTAIAGVLRWSCERCMLRREGDFLFCWTAMVKLLWLSMLALHDAAQVCKRRARRLVVPFRSCFALVVPRRVRQREDQLVFHEGAYVHLLPCDHAVGR